MSIELKQIAAVKMGYSLREGLADHDSVGGLRIVLPKDVSVLSGCFSESDPTMISMKSPEKHLVGQEEVLFLARGKFVAIPRKSLKDQKVVASGFFLRIVPVAPGVLPEYIALYLNSAAGKAQINRLCGGGAILSVTKAALESIQVPLIPIEKQRMFVEYNDLLMRAFSLQTRKCELQKKLFDNIMSKTIRNTDD